MITVWSFDSQLQLNFQQIYCLHEIYILESVCVCVCVGGGGGGGGGGWHVGNHYHLEIQSSPDNSNIQSRKIAKSASYRELEANNLK